MPELPDIIVYCEALEREFGGVTIQSVDIRSPFLVRTFAPTVDSVHGKRLSRVFRMGKRIVWDFERELYLVFHLMIAGRFHLRKPQSKPGSKSDLAAFQFPNATLMLTEAGSKKRASLHVVEGAAGLDAFDRQGLDVLSSDLAAFRERLTLRNHTVKRALTDPRLFDGIGNAYSDEILHASQLSPVKWTSRLTDEEVERLFLATTNTLQTWIDRLSAEAKSRFPKKVTAFRPEMAVHGKYGTPCPVCETEVQRIRYADNETNYCPRCQTDGKLLADRSLSRLLKGDWPRTIEELEE